MPKTTQALEVVQDLYSLQQKLWSMLDSDLSDPKVRKEARAQVKAFEQLLRAADWRFMGGMDVYESLEKVPGEVIVHLKSYPMTKGKVRKERVVKKTIRRKKRK
ncbi:MAG: hypothetical protein Q7R81_07795 [Candidatus Peregrinibacteria bacterium]|nr:hypothetical protein [Candidatus Peregrinibacteria bacterium]